MSQSSAIDSLKSNLSNAEGQVRIQILLDLAKLSQSNQPEVALNYAAEALEQLKTVPEAELEIEAHYRSAWAGIFARKYDIALTQAGLVDSIAQVHQSDGGTAKALLLKARIARQQGQYEKSIKHIDNALLLAENFSDELLKLQLLNELGSVHRRLGENTKALGYHMQALDLSRQRDDKANISSTLSYIGIVHDILGNYDQSLKYQQETLAIRKELNDRRGVAAALTNIGIMHQKTKSYQEALRFYSEALAIWEELNKEPEMAAVYNNVGAVQELLNNYEDALKNYEKALAIWKKYEQIHSIPIALGNIGYLNMLMGNNEDALDIYKQSLDIYLDLGDRYGSSGSLLDLAEIYQKLGQTNFALESAREGLELAKETDSWPLIREAHEILTSIYEAREDYADALTHFKAFKAANDSVFNIESQSVIADLQQQYNTLEQQQQIELLQQQGKIQNLWMGILIGGLALSGFVLLLLYNRYTLKQKALKTEQELHDKEIEQERLHTERAEAQARFLEADNKRKTGELEAARELQLSLLPSEIPAHPYLNISAFMKTATEVGGDYYDFDLAEDGALTIAIGDATGHGAKAGTMVTAVKSIFNLLAHNKELTEILSFSSKAIKKMNMSQMYMALAFLRLKDNQLEFAGAGMPPALIYRAGEKRIEQVPLKGMPLGSVDDYPYEKRAVSLKKDDVVLLSSDGFAELFNNDGEMLSYEIVPKLLVEVAEKSPEEIIDHLKKTASKWLGENVMPQDDMTFIVLKSKVDF